MRLPSVAPLLFLAISAACRAPSAAAAPSDAPYVLVLGTAQDGGLPQIGCENVCCRAAVAEPEARRLVTSLLLVDPRAGRRWLFDASPDLREQVELAREHAAPPARPDGQRPPLFDGIFLTHAHSGHYTGLLHLGREAYGVGAPLYASERMGRFLSQEQPWSAIVGSEGTQLHVVSPFEEVALAPDLTVSPIPVPHRDEFSDTYAWLVRGPKRSLLYLPDIDKWERWDEWGGASIEDWLLEVDVALLDGTFFGEGEIPGRSLAEIPHPFIVESLARFGDLPAARRARVHFTHLNHTNPATAPEGEAAAQVRRAGMRIARDLDVHPL